MDNSVKNRLDTLILQSQNMGAEENGLENFAIQWHIFLDELDTKDKKIAVEAYFQGIFDNIEIIKKGIQEVAENISEKERQEYFNEFEKMKELLISSRTNAPV